MKTIYIKVTVLDRVSGHCIFRAHGWSLLVLIYYRSWTQTEVMNDCFKNNIKIEICYCTLLFRDL